MAGCGARRSRTRRKEGREALRLAPGEAGAVADARIGSAGPPPTAGEFKTWRIRGRADGVPFEIVGFLGYGPSEGAVAAAASGVPQWAIALAAAPGVLTVAAALALPLRRRKGES